MRINHNIPALRALHELGRTNSALDKTLQRLSSGLRITRAADDAAGLAISQKMDTQVRGLKQANRNAMDGISLIQTAEGALNEVHDMLQRMRELSVQVSNGTYDSTDRKAVNDEIKQLQDEVQRISEHIEFNERKLLNGEIDRRAFPDDETVGQIVSLSDTVKPGTYTINVTADATKAKIEGGKSESNFTGGVVQASQAGKININGEEVRIEAGDTAEEVFNKLRNLSETVGANLIAYEDDGSGNPDYAAGAKQFVFNSNMHLVFETKEYGSEYHLDINASNTTLLADLGISTTKATGTDVKASIDSTNSDFNATATVTTKGNVITVSDIDGFTMKFQAQDGTVANNTVYQAGIGTATSLSTTPEDKVKGVLAIMEAFAAGKNSAQAQAAGEAAGIDASDSLAVVNNMLSAAVAKADAAISPGALTAAEQTALNGALGQTDEDIVTAVMGAGSLTKEEATLAVAAYKAELCNHTNVKVLDAGPLDLQIGANEGQFMEVRIPNLSPQALGIDKINLSTADGAQNAITVIDNAIGEISSVRSKLGAYQNRLEHTVANLDVAAENMTASLSRIQDADMAEEMAEYTQKNILMQAGTSMLAQANQRPQAILQLLQQ